MNRHTEPNASHFSARYAARKLAAQRARDASAGPSPCNHCRTPRAPGSIFCAAHAVAYTELLAKQDFEACARFCARTYWP